MTEELAAKLRALAHHRAAMAEPGYTFGHWVDAWKTAEGVTHLPWFEPSPAALAFLRDIGQAGWILPFDWPAWMETPEAQAYRDDPARVASASVEDLSRLLTAIVRSDRFTEGSLAAAFESGLIRAIVDRADALAAELGDR